MAAVKYEIWLNRCPRIIVSQRVPLQFLTLLEKTRDSRKVGVEYSSSINQLPLGSSERRQRVPPSFSLCTMVVGGVVVVNALDSPRALSPGVLSTCTVSNRAERLYGYDGVSVQLLQTFAIRASVHAVHSIIPTLLLAVKERERENGSN